MASQRKWCNCCSGVCKFNIMQVAADCVAESRQTGQLMWSTQLDYRLDSSAVSNLLLFGYQSDQSLDIDFFFFLSEMQQSSEQSLKFTAMKQLTEFCEAPLNSVFPKIVSYKIIQCCYSNTSNSLRCSSAQHICAHTSQHNTHTDIIITHQHKPDCPGWRATGSFRSRQTSDQQFKEEQSKQVWMLLDY